MASIRRLPLFPLNLVLYPLERLPLHIFEPRYIEMVQFCLARSTPFVIVLQHEGKTAGVGCTARIERIVERMDDGRMDIVVVGEERVRLQNIFSNLPYLTAEVEAVPDLPEEPDSTGKERAITQHMRLLELAGRTVRPSLYQHVEYVSFVLAPNAGLDPLQKQQVLEMVSEAERIAFLTEHFETLIPRIERMASLRQKVRSNGHFKDFPPEP